MRLRMRRAVAGCSASVAHHDRERLVTTDAPDRRPIDCGRDRVCDGGAANRLWRDPIAVQLRCDHRAPNWLIRSIAME